MHPPLAAYLRVYEPLAAFEDEHADFWRRYIAQDVRIDTADGPAIQRAFLYSRVGPEWTRLPEFPPHAYVIDGERGPLVCPWRLRARSAAAVRDWPGSFGTELVGAYASGSLLRQANEKAMRRRSRRWHEHIALWRVPLRWFTLVDATEREIDADVPRLRYRVPMARARRRSLLATEILRKSLGRGNLLTVSMRQQSEWLSGFHSRAVVEVDYGGLTRTFTARQLLSDESPTEVGDALTTLASGDLDAAEARYDRLLERWRPTRLREHDN